MTIALGALTPAGVLVAADSEESTPDLKSSVGKIAFYSAMSLDKERSRGNATFDSIAISGAGDSAYLAAIKQHLIDDFKDASVKNADDFDVILRRRVKTFYHDHVRPFYVFSDLDLRINLVVAVCCASTCRLWVTNLTTVRNMNMFGVAYVGSGERWASTVIGPTMPVFDQIPLSIVAAFGIFYAKEYAGGCGKQTRIISLGKNVAPVFARQEALEQLDALFRRYEGFNSFMRNCVLGVPSIEFAKIAGIEARLTSFRQEIEEISRTLYSQSPLTSQGDAEPPRE